MRRRTGAAPARPTHHFFELCVGGSDRRPRAPARSDPMCKRAFDRMSPDALNRGGGSAAGTIAAPKEARDAPTAPDFSRSEEHTSELQSLMRISYAVFCLKKKKTKEHSI